MKKTAVPVLVLALVLCSACVTAPPPRQAGPAVEDLHRSMSVEALPALAELIQGSGDNYTRERAVFVYADVSRLNGKGREAMEFLKKVAYEERNEEVRTAAYVNYYLLRQEEPPLLTLNVTVQGEIRPGRTVTITALVSSAKEFNETTVFLQAESPDTGLKTTTIVGQDRVSSRIMAGTPLSVPFTVSLLREGDAILRLRVKSVQDRLEYEEVDRTVFLKISDSGGSYQVV